MQLVTVFGILLCLSYVSAGCEFPSDLWCSSGEIAKRCGVYDQCVESSRRSSSAGPVNLTLYYESLCPDCRRFFQEQLYQTWSALDQDRLTVLNLTLVPYGNAREKKMGDIWYFQCQHGGLECLGNLIDTCAIDIVKNVSVYFPYIHCMEASSASPSEAATACAVKFDIDVDPILKCANGRMGNSLEHQMALKTDALNPPHKYVPWVTINGVHTEKMEHLAEEDLLKLICDTYQGPPPPACSQKAQQRERKCYNRK